MKKYNIAVVGATGMVGNKFLQVLTERKLPVDNYYLYASKRSAGNKINFMDKDHEIIELAEQNIRGKKIDIALFSAGGSISRDFAPIFVEAGAIVIDNSSYWRMDKDVPLVVPEVNGQAILKHKGIIANPNCSTIQAVVALKPLHDAYKIKRVIYSTYQSVSGAGMGGYTDLIEGAKGNPPQKFPHPIFNNLIPQIDVFEECGYTKEELKMIDETKKIFEAPDLKVTATTVRVPITYGHSESINIEFEKPCTLDGIMSALKNADGVVLCDDTANGVYPMPYLCEDKDEVYVGRVRLDDTVPSGCNIFVVADNIRKGAATNAVQIAEWIVGRF